MAEVCEAVGRAGQSTALPRLCQPQLPLQIISQHLSLHAAASFCSFHTYKVAFQGKLEKTLFKAPGAHVRSFNLFQDGLG